MAQTPATLEVRAAVPADVAGILALISRAYPGIENYSLGQISGQINNFPEGQFVAVLEGAIVGYCASSRIDEAIALAPHDWATITGNGFGSRHDPTGDWLYGIEMAVDERQRGLRIGKRLYDARRALAERLELRGIVFGGRMPGYARVKSKVSGPADYLTQVREGKFRDQVIGFQLRNGF
ncbi:MAG: family N-acetyltransferase, partial [Alphaproteobacteria bacterium]|nr:family N-acetyltransferase [Alphaproteobacteria bacterium]